MRTQTLAPFALAIAGALSPAGPARAQLDEAPPPADAAADRGYPWLCTIMSVAAVGGLFAAVRRRERAVEADRKRGIRPEPVWYCRRCDRDVSGQECPRCQAPNPFAHEPAEWSVQARRNGR
jgi:hypothetical protein